MKAIAAASVLLLSLLARASQPVPYTYQGTVQAVQPKAASLDLITGVGEALRLVHMRTLTTTRLSSAGAAISFAEIRPGDVVRAECRMTDTGLVADRIEILAAAGSAVERKP